jgi:hypothetical protein
MAKIASDKLERTYSRVLLAIIVVAFLPVELAAQDALHRHKEEPSSQAAADGVQEAAGEVAEGTQNALNLRNLLFGRNYLFYGRVEVDLAGYSGDIPPARMVRNCEGCVWVWRA